MNRKYTVKSAMKTELQEGNFVIFDPAELHSALLLLNKVCDIAAAVGALFPFVEARWNNMSAEVEEYDTKANTLLNCVPH